MSANQSIRIPSYRKHKASGQAVCTVKDAAGKPHDVYLGKFDSPESRLEYQRVMSEYRSGRVYERPESPKDILVVELCESYLEWATTYYTKGGRSTSELANVKRAIRCLRECWPDLEAREFSPRKLMTCQRKLIADGLLRSNINRYSGVILRIFEHGVKHEMIPSAFMRDGVPTATIDALKTVGTLPANRNGVRESEPVGPVSDGDREAVLPFLNEPYRSMVRIQYLLACRPGELVSMSPDQIDQTTTDPEGRMVWSYWPRSHKTQHHHKDRMIPVGPQAQALIKPFLGFEGVRMFRNGRRSPVSEKCYAGAIRRACRAAGISEWSPNKLRHAGSTRIRKLNDAEAAQVILGHSNINTTEIYAERNLSHALKVAAEVG